VANGSRHTGAEDHKLRPSWSPMVIVSCAVLPTMSCTAKG